MSKFGQKKLRGRAQNLPKVAGTHLGLGESEFSEIGKKVGFSKGIWDIKKFAVRAAQAPRGPQPDFLRGRRGPVSGQKAPTQNLGEKKSHLPRETRDKWLL